jgi:hypothetical protein
MDGLRVVRWGLVFAFLSIGFGFGMGALFGANEDAMKAGLKAGGEAVLAEKYGGDAARLKAVLDKSWAYYKRAHLHGGGIGAVALGLCLLLASLRGAARARALAGLAAGVGALGYAVYWLLAGMRAPGLGSTDAAKESLAWLAIPTSGLAIVGLLLAFALTLRALFARSD